MKNIVVTGGSGGLGFSLVKTLSSTSFTNYRVIATVRSKSEKLVQLAEDSLGKVVIEHLDLAKQDTLHAFVKTITTKYGKIYGLVNNAAMGLDGVLGTMHESDIAKVICVNLTNTIILTKYVSRSMLISGEGRIINISSIIANTGFSGLSVYGASKAGLIGFTKSLARELGKRNILVNAIAPGYMETSMTQGISEDNFSKIIRRSPLRKLVEVDEVSNMVEILLCEKRSMTTTGSVFTLDGGSTC